MSKSKFRRNYFPLLQEKNRKKKIADDYLVVVIIIYKNHSQAFLLDKRHHLDRYNNHSMILLQHINSHSQCQFDTADTIWFLCFLK